MGEAEGVKRGENWDGRTGASEHISIIQVGGDLSLSVTKIPRVRGCKARVISTGQNASGGGGTP